MAAATKAQLAVWGLIAGLSVWGITALSRLQAPDGAPAATEDAVALQQQPAPVTPATPATLPATIPEFPFPDELMVASPGEPQAVETPQLVEGIIAIPSDAIPEISAFDGDGPEPVAPLTAGEPPIPMPGRPMAARPAEAVPLSEVKTLYVMADMLNIRGAPSTTGPVLQKVPQGFAVAPQQRSNEWIGFLMRDGTTGWMRTDYLSDTKPPVETPKPASATEPLNLMM